MKRIIIVDDEETILNLFSRFFEQFGYVVLSTPCAKAAIELMHRHGPQLLITDVFMPEMDGLELIQAVRKHSDLNRHIRIIALSGGSYLSGQTHLERAKQFGADCAFEKPVKMNILLGAVRELLD